MAAGSRENTRTYLEKAIGNEYQMLSCGYSSNGIIRRTTIVGEGLVYVCGEKVSRLAASGLFRTDVGVLSDYQVTSNTGQFDTITMVFEELLTRNGAGFAVYTNLRSATASIPLKFNVNSQTETSKYEAKSSYEYSWDHTIYTANEDKKTITETEYTDWSILGWNFDAYDDKLDQLNIADVEDNKIDVLPAGQRPKPNWAPAVFADGDNVGMANSPSLPETKTYYIPDITLTQTIYCENDLIVRNIIEANGRLFAPRQTDRSKYDTYAIRSSDDTTVRDDNEYWLCLLQSIDTQSSISKLTVAFRYRESGWSKNVYQAYKRGWDAFTDTATAASQPTIYF